ncbi:MAG TPA: TonB-dependent receptor [Kofleriaceae bacterium]|nr:TonB-dependent receptor [Kofleriaceae bacterium]
MCAWVGVATAQVTTANVRGTVTSAEDATPFAGVEVTLVNESTGSFKTTTTNDVGEYAFTGLDVGGPYRVTATLEGFKPSEVKGFSLSAGKTRDVDLQLRLQEEVIEVKGTAVPRNASNKTVITSQEIEQLPSIGRDPRDLVRRTPEASVEGRDHTMSIGGMNTRFNSITVDGIREDDDFGLNTSGYPTRRSPIALSAIQEMTVESAPFDVRYSKFMGGNVNVITKSGTNDIHGALLFTYSSDALLGDKTGEQTLTGVKFRELRAGAALGGPILQDRAHFFVSLEGLSGTSPVSAGPAGSSAVNESSKVTQDDLSMAQQIAHDVYNFDAGVPDRALDETDFKVFAKSDFQVTKEHRLIASYQRTAGDQDTSSGSSDSRLSLSSNWYEQADTLNTLALRLQSDWSDKLSTQVDLNGKLVSSRPTPLNGNGFMAAQIRTASGGTIVLGPDDFRHTNRLDNDLFHVKTEANYLEKKHLLTGGLEYEVLRIDNLFIADTNGGAIYPSLDAFRMMQPTSITYSNSVSGNPEDASAKWASGTLGAYAQDQLKLSDELTLQGGLRLETYTAGDKITVNERFYNRYGFSNAATLSGRSILMPRLGVSYLATEDLNLRAGAGLYSGGSPTVWVSNGYSNDGVRIASAFSNQAAVVGGFDGRNIPQALSDMVKAGDGNVDALDPDFKIPSAWKVGTGGDYGFAQGAMLKFNYTFTKVLEGVLWKDLRRDLSSIPNNTPIGETVDGRPLYDTANFNPRRGYDMLLTNTRRGYGHVASLSLEKSFSFGLFIAGTYAYQHVLEVSPANSSRSVSNYNSVAVSDPQTPDLAISNYQRAHRFTLGLELTRALVAQVSDARPWKDMKTSIGLFAEARSGQPYSWTFGDASFGQTLGKIFGEDATFASKNRELFYVPKGDGSDVILNNIDQAAFDDFLKRTGLDKYRGQIAPRNAFHSPWFKKVDMRIAQDLPNPFTDHRARVVIDIENVGNLLYHKWGRATGVGFPYATPAVDVGIDTPTGKYVYSNLRNPNPDVVDVLASVWRVGIGVMYDF